MLTIKYKNNMKELTDDQKLRLYSQPEISQEDQIQNEITGYNRLISEAQQFVLEIQDLNQVKFLSQQFITFHEKRITDKEIIKKFYEILIADWHYKIDSAKKELSQLKGGVIATDTIEDKLDEVRSQITDPNPDDINAEFPVKKKSKFGAFLEKLFSYADKTVTILRETNVIKDKK